MARRAVIDVYVDIVIVYVIVLVLFVLGLSLVGSHMGVFP